MRSSWPALQAVRKLMIHLFLKNIFPRCRCAERIVPAARSMTRRDRIPSVMVRAGAPSTPLISKKGVDTGLRRYDEESPQPGHIEKDILQTRYGHEFRTA